MAGMSLRQFADRIGVTLQAVQKAIATGRVPAAAVGAIKTGSGKTRRCIKNPELAAKSWAGNTNSNQQRNNKKISAAKIKSFAEARGEPPPPPPPDDEESPPVVITTRRRKLGEVELPSQAESRAVTELYNAKIKELEYKEKAGKLVDVEKVRAGMAEMIVDVRTKILSVPKKARLRHLPHLNIDDVEVLTELLTQALEELAVGS